MSREKQTMSEPQTNRKPSLPGGEGALAAKGFELARQQSRAGRPAGCTEAGQQPRHKLLDNGDPHFVNPKESCTTAFPSVSIRWIS